MSRPRFRPVLAVSNPRHFGRVEQPEWAVPCPLGARDRTWAVLQHRAAFVVHTAFASGLLSLDDLAWEVGEAPGWLRRKLTGQVPADVGDLVAWALVLGVDVWPVLESGDLG